MFNTMRKEFDITSPLEADGRKSFKRTPNRVEERNIEPQRLLDLELHEDAFPSQLRPF